MYSIIEGLFVFFLVLAITILLLVLVIRGLSHFISLDPRFLLLFFVVSLIMIRNKERKNND
jgi:hypothetical protein